MVSIFLSSSLHIPVKFPSRVLSMMPCCYEALCSMVSLSTSLDNKSKHIRQPVLIVSSLPGGGRRHTMGMPRENSLQVTQGPTMTLAPNLQRYIAQPVPPYPKVHSQVCPSPYPEVPAPPVPLPSTRYQPCLFLSAL